MTAASDSFKADGLMVFYPATFAAICSPSDSVDLATVPRAILLSAAGNVKVDMLAHQDGNANQTGLTLPLPGGVLIPIRPTKIYATGTDAVTITLFW